MIKRLADAFARANEIINQSDSAEVTWHKRIRVVNPSHWLQRPKINDEVFKRIRTAVLQAEVVNFDYKKHTNDQVIDEIEGTALGLYYRGPVAYFIVFFIKVKSQNTTH